MHSPPALRALELPLAPALVLLSLLGAALALRAHRARLTSARSALLYGCLPSTLWLVVASLRPEQPTWLLLTPFGAALGLAFLGGLAAARSAAQRAFLDDAHSVDGYLWSCAGGLVGARLAYVVAHAAEFPGGQGLLDLHAGGLAMNGALLGAVGVARWYFRAQPLGWRTWLDALAPALGLALSLGSLGLYLQDPTRWYSLGGAAAGLLMCGVTGLRDRWQRFDGQSFVLVAIGYGIVQLSVSAPRSAALSSADAGQGWTAAAVSWLVIVLALAAGWFWHKSFTLRRI